MDCSSFPAAKRETRIRRADDRGGKAVGLGDVLEHLKSFNLENCYMR